MTKRKIIFFFLLSFILFLILKSPRNLFSPKYGVAGKVEERGAISNLNKVKVALKKEQKEAFEKVYPNYNLASLIQLSGKVLEVNQGAQVIKVATNENQGWVKISSNWHGNVLAKEETTGRYLEVGVINLARGEWLKMMGYLNKAKKVLLLCPDEWCQESISGHIYLD